MLCLQKSGSDQTGQRTCSRGVSWFWFCSWSLMVQCVSLWSESQQQVLLTLLMVIRTKQIIGLKPGSCFLLLPAAAACLSTNNLITELGSARSHTPKQTHTCRNPHIFFFNHRATVSVGSVCSAFNGNVVMQWDIIS